MKFDIPFIHDIEYINFITTNQEYIHSIYFSLPSATTSDARVITHTIDLFEFDAFLGFTPRQIKKYITINGRYTPFDLYSSEVLKSTMLYLKILYNSNNLTGLIFLDYYYIQLLSKLDPEFTKELELIPSINCYIDSIDKFYNYINHIKLLPFKPPSKIILDRSLNRDQNKLIDICSKIKEYDSNIKIGLLANEGCLYQCPFKINHDISISLINDRSISNTIYLNNKLTNNDFEFQFLNQKYGCLNHILNNPVDILKSPFIRPEDIDNYNVDIIKLTGKVRLFSYLNLTFNAYLSRIYNGNLLDLLDSLSFFNEKFYIFNDQIPKDFFKITSNCNKNCNSCNYCTSIFDKNVQILKG
jgi:hypothetical protein